MIAIVESVDELGVLAGFSWPANLAHFNRLNLVYGWNYSGKTTLSRVFAALQANGFPEHHKLATATLGLHGGGQCTIPGAGHGLHVRVFNSDFVKANLLFDQSQAAPLLVLGEDVIEKHRELGTKQEERTQVISQREAVDAKLQAAADQLDRVLSAAARDVKTQWSVPGYDRAKFEKVVRGIGEAPRAHLLDPHKLEEKSKIYRSSEKRARCEAVRPDWIPTAASLTKNAETVINRSVRSSGLEELRVNPALESWIQVGIRLHAPGDNCKFCTAPLLSPRLASLLEHFESEYGKFIGELDAIIRGIERAVVVDLPGPHETQLYPEIQQRYLAARGRLVDALQRRRDALQGVLDALSKKRLSLSATVQFSGQAAVDALVARAIGEINNLIAEHNARTDQFAESRQVAFDAIEKHTAATFANEHQYWQRLRERDELERQKSALLARETSLKAEIDALQKAIDKPARAAEYINQLLQMSFGSDSLQLRAEADGSLRLYRRERLALHLSDGERTAIAFAYFTAGVCHGPVELGQLVIVLDDPISSLDSHHIFNVYATIKTKMAGCLQLFVFTHSFEFFVLVRDWLSDEEGKAQRPLDQWREARLYLLSRRSEGVANLVALPRELLKYRSEYHFLFATLRHVDRGQSLDMADLLGMPNIVRRFIEAFAGIMIPLHEGLEKKMEKLFLDPLVRERVLRFVHHYSHNTTITRALLVPDLSECRTVVSACLQMAKQWEPRHYSYLEQSLA